MTYHEEFAKNVGGKIAGGAGDGGDFASPALSPEDERDLERETLGLRFGEAVEDGADTPGTGHTNAGHSDAGHPDGLAAPRILSREAAEGKQVQDDEDRLVVVDEQSSAGSPPTDQNALTAPPAPSPTPTSTPAQRHDGWTPDIRVKFLEALANCGNVGSAAIYVQRSRTSAYGLKRRDLDFARGWNAALLIARDASSDVLQDRAINGIEEDVYHGGEVIGTRRRYDSRLLLAHIARLDRLAERVSVSRAAARFDQMIEAIAAEEDTTALISEPTADEIADIIAETEAVATAQEVEKDYWKLSMKAEKAEKKKAKKEKSEAADLARHGPVHEIDWGDGGPSEYHRMFEAAAAKLCEDHPKVKAHRVEMDDPGLLAAPAKLRWL